MDPRAQAKRIYANRLWHMINSLISRMSSSATNREPYATTLEVLLCVH